MFIDHPATHRRPGDVTRAVVEANAPGDRPAGVAVRGNTRA